MRDGDDLYAQGKRIEQLAQEAAYLRERQFSRADRLDDLAREVEEMAAKLDVAVPAPLSDSGERPQVLVLPADLLAAAGTLGRETLGRLDKEFLHSVPAVPPMDDLDRFVVIAVGCMAALADFLWVGLPPKTKWTPGNEGGVVPVGWLSARLKSWNVASENRLADRFPVPFDTQQVPGMHIGFSGVNHRVLSIGHDPSPLGFVIGLMDIVSGGLTGVTYDGQPFSVHVEEVPASWTTVCLAPVVWLGHLISDVATPMGLPVPGSSLFQMLRLPVPGAPGNATLADVTRTLYQRGYDFRHYIAGGVVPGLVEALIRLYEWLRYSEEASSVARDPVLSMRAEQFVHGVQANARLTSLLFWTHAIAAGANAGRVTLQGCTGDFFSAARSVNLAQWQMFAFRTIQYVQVKLRDTTLDQAIANRERIEQRWKDLSMGIGTAGLLYGGDASGHGGAVL